MYIYHSLALAYGLKRKAFSPRDGQSLGENQTTLISELNDMASKGRGLKLLYFLSHLVLVPFFIFTLSNPEKDVLLNHQGGLSLLGICIAGLVFICIHLYEFWYRNFKVCKIKQYSIIIDLVGT